MSGFFETYRGRVLASECDHLGHMNIQFYVARMSDAAWALMNEIGMSPSYLKERRQAVAAVRNEIDYLRELKAGDVIAMESAILEVGARKMRFIHRLTDTETGEIAMTARVVGVNMDLETRKAVPFDDAVRAAAQSLIVSEDAL